ncbi:MAG: haloacid dehalogenase-like hydrolase [Pseudomonadota bacterium]|nr:haloacid dehalogenase-like hydrolase [Pseudomonadota bacterium]
MNFKKHKNSSEDIFLQKKIAIVYDFDGTLTPQPMQEYTVLPELGIEPKIFWAEVEAETVKTRGDPILTYMRLLVEKIETNKKHLSRKSLRKSAQQIKYFSGVTTWFERINNYVKLKTNNKIEIFHYIISAGLKEILEGITIKKNFKQIYASQYYFDHHEAAKFPTIVINDTTKTQFLFRINKGLERTLDNINEYMPEKIRPIPFCNMLYIGDGLTDVPSMTVVKKNEGFAIAVYKKNNIKSQAVCSQLLKGNRIDFYAEADYEESSELETQTKKILDLMISKIRFEEERHNFMRKIFKNE